VNDEIHIVAPSALVLEEHLDQEELHAIFRSSQRKTARTLLNVRFFRPIYSAVTHWARSRHTHTRQSLCVATASFLKTIIALP
jgi:hypothetical protein